MTIFRFSVISITLFVVLFIVWLVSFVSQQQQGQQAANRISKKCDLSVYAGQDDQDRRFGLGIGAIHLACPAPNDRVRVACARQEIAKTSFREVDYIYTGSCPERGIYE